MLPRTAAKVTQADIARAARALRAAGVARVRVVFRAEGISVEADDERGPEAPAPVARREKVIVL